MGGRKPEIPTTDKSLNDVNFLFNKLDVDKKRIFEGLLVFQRRMGDALAEPLKTMAAKQARGSGHVVEIEAMIRNFEPNDTVFMDLDTFITDARRCLEFGLRTLCRAEGVPEAKFSFQNLLDHLRPGSKETPSALVKMLQVKFPRLIDHVRKQMDALQHLEDLRTSSIHYAVQNRVDGCRVVYKFRDAKEGFKVEPAGFQVGVQVFGRDLPKFVTDTLALVAGFIDEIAERTPRPV